MKIFEKVMKREVETKKKYENSKFLIPNKIQQRLVNYSGLWSNLHL